MKIQFHSLSYGMIFVIILAIFIGFGASAAEVSTEPAIIPAETVAPTEPEETFPETEPPKQYEIDTESELFLACDALAEELDDYTQILIYDSKTDEILYARTNTGDKLYPASITKLYTCYVALQHLDPYDILTAGDELSLVQPGSSKAYIYKNQRVSVRTVIQGMLLPSGNDAAMILAANAGRRIAGDETLEATEAVNVFVDEMNRMVEELGFEGSHFANPDGFHSGAHYTCLKDMARIAKLALEDKTISYIIRLFEQEVTYTSGQENTWKNTNLYLDPENSFHRGDAVGMKTGYTKQAGYSLMSAFRHGKTTLVVGVFGCKDGYNRYRYTNKLLKICYEYI